MHGNSTSQNKTAEEGVNNKNKQEPNVMSSPVDFWPLLPNLPTTATEPLFEECSKEIGLRISLIVAEPMWSHKMHEKTIIKYMKMPVKKMIHPKDGGHHPTRLLFVCYRSVYAST